MAQVSSYNVANRTGAQVRADINDIYEAIKTCNSGTSDPSTPEKFMLYGDSAVGDDNLKIYDGAQFRTIGKVTEDNLGLLPKAGGTMTGQFLADDGGTVAAPAIAFNNDTDTGLYRVNSNELGIAANATNIATFTIGGQILAGNLSVAPTTGEANIQVQTNNLNNEDAYIDFVADTTYTDYGLRLLRGATGANTVSQLDHRGTGALEVIAHDGGTIDFKCGVAASNTLVTRWKFDSAGVFKWAEHSGTLPSGANVSGVIVPKGLASKTGSNAAATLSGNLYNFYWDGSSPNQLKCWIDEQDVGQVSGPSSDYRIKRNIATQTESGIDKIKKLRPITYQYADYKVFKASDSIREGFIAHEVQEVIPSGADGVKDGDSIQSLNIDAIVSVLTKALQEAVAKIETLEAKVAALESN